ncbi:hypothetical protein B296_00032945, partial [Ensete ventricosum]
DERVKGNTPRRLSAATNPARSPSPREQSGPASTESETPVISTSLIAAPLLTP